MNDHIPPQFVVEWSRQQASLRAMPLATALAETQEAFLHNQPYDWRVLWIGPRESCSAALSSWSSRLPGHGQQGRAA